MDPLLWGETDISVVLQLQPDPSVGAEELGRRIRCYGVSQIYPWCYIKLCLPYLYVTVLVQQLGDNVVDFVFKVLSQSSCSLGYVGDKPCWKSVVDNTLSLITLLTRFPNVSYWIVRVLVLPDLVVDDLANFDG